MAVSKALGEFSIAFNEAQAEYEECSIDKVNLAYNNFVAAAKADTSRDWTEDISSVHRFMTELKLARTMEPATASSVLRSLQNSDERPKRSSRRHRHSHSARNTPSNDVRSFVVQTVGGQDPDQFDWTHFERDLGKMEPTFRAAFERAGPPTRGEFAKTIYREHDGEQVIEAMEAEAAEAVPHRSTANEDQVMSDC